MLPRQHNVDQCQQRALSLILRDYEGPRCLSEEWANDFV